MPGRSRAGSRLRGKGQVAGCQAREREAGSSFCGRANEVRCGWPRTRGTASPWRRGQSVASLRLALQLRQEQLGGGRLLPTAETRKVPSPLNKHTQVLGHRKMLGETGMPSVRCGGGQGGASNRQVRGAEQAAGFRKGWESAPSRTERRSSREVCDLPRRLAEPF